MTRSLPGRLALAMIGVGAGAVLLVTVMLNLLLVDRFEAYLKENVRTRASQLAAALEDAYRRDPSWQGDAVLQLAHLASMEGLRLQVLDPRRGRVMLDSQSVPLPAAMARSGARAGRETDQAGRAAGQPGPPRQGSLRGWTSELPLSLDGAVVGYLLVRPDPLRGAFTAHDLHFVLEVNRFLGLAALVVLLLAVGISLWMSRALTAPLRAMTGVAGAMGRGDLTLRARPGGTDETRSLAQALNRLAESLEQQEKLRRAMAADVAHELRTPVAAVKSYLEAFADGVWEPSRERLAVLGEQVKRLEGLVADLGRLMEAEAAALNLTRTPFDLADLVRQQGLAMAALFASRQVAFHTHTGDPIPVPGDREKVARILGNLLANALKFTPAGGRVDLEAGHEIDRAFVRVRDTGPGIPEADMPHIFERFYRGEKSRSRATGGAGLGLTIALALARAHGGAIEAASTPGQGATFTLWLPLGQPAGWAAPAW